MVIQAGEASQAAAGESFDTLMQAASGCWDRRDFRQAHVLSMAAALLVEDGTPEMDLAIACAGHALQASGSSSRPDPDLVPAVIPPVVLGQGVPVYRQLADGTWEGPILGDAPPGASWVRAGQR